jgi:putative membrane protein
MSYVLQHWSGDWVVLALWAVLVAAHVAGLLRCLQRRGADSASGDWASGDRASSDRASGVRPRRLVREAVAFQGGLLVALLALISPFGYWSGLYIWVRSLQDLLLALVAPGLIVLGAPWLVLASLGRRRPAGGQAAAPARPATEADQVPGLLRERSWLSRPVAIVVAFNVVWLGWHVPALYDLAARHSGARYLEYVTYLAAGTAFWLQLIRSRPLQPVLPAVQRLTLVILTAAADGVLGMVLVFGSGLLYPAYIGPHHHVLSVVSDQQVAGAVLWMGVLPPLIVVAVALINNWLDAEESDELSRDLDRVMGRAPAVPAMPSPGKPVWHARSGYRRPTI